MEAETLLYQTPGESPLPREVFVPILAPAHRPRQAFRLRIESLEGLRIARRRGVPVYALTGDVPTRFHFPMRLGPILFIDEIWRKALVSRYPSHRYRDFLALRTPSFEDLVTMVTAIYPAAGRAMCLRNPGRLDRDRLAIAITREGLAAWATAFRFQDFAPAIPRIGRSQPREVLDRADRENPG